MEPGSQVTERKMLLGIKERAERLGSQQASTESGKRSPAPADA
jgi:hypothetical protein